MSPVLATVAALIRTSAARILVVKVVAAACEAKRRCRWEAALARVESTVAALAALNHWEKGNVKGFVWSCVFSILSGGRLLQDLTST